MRIPVSQPAALERTRALRCTPVCSAVLTVFAPLVSTPSSEYAAQHRPPAARLAYSQCRPVRFRPRHAGLVGGAAAVRLPALRRRVRAARHNALPRGVRLRRPQSERRLSAPLSSSRHLSAPLGSSRLLSAPLGTSRLLSAPRGSSRLLSAPRGSSRLLAAPLGSSRLLSAPRGTSRLLAAPLGSSRQAAELEEMERLGAVLEEEWSEVPWEDF